MACSKYDLFKNNNATFRFFIKVLAMPVVHYYRTPAFSNEHLKAKLNILKKIDPQIENIEIEKCFNIEINGSMTEDEHYKLKWILSDPLKHATLDITNVSQLVSKSKFDSLLEIGPRLNFSTPFSTNAVSICYSIGLTQIKRVEVSIRYLIIRNNLQHVPHEEVIAELHDKMTECVYLEPITSFDHGIKPEPWYFVDVINRGQLALKEINDKLGLSFDEWDLNYYTELFNQSLKRNPTSVECFDLAQSNSEHSRHWFFKGKIVIDGKEQPKSLLDMIIETQQFSNSNNIIKFSDNSSAIKGFIVNCLKPEKVYKPSRFKIISKETHLIFTAETHNFPTAVSPFSGATTGTGGRIRDIQAVGRGGHTIAATAGYAIGNLLISGYKLPWEDDSFTYSNNFAKPLDILIEASNGASDYGNKFGEPVIAGFVRSFGLVDCNGERKEYVKPIMFSGGIGKMDAEFVSKRRPQKGMKVVKVGGPIYRIGIGGGAASSTHIQGDNKRDLDFGAVQRGDAEMGQKLNRIVRACMENEKCNPILSIHDQGAGGNGNVLKEIVEPEGAVIFTKAFQLGDSSISTLELWGAEYQESNAILCESDHTPLLQNISHRERCPIDVVGLITGTGWVVLTEDENIDHNTYLSSTKNPRNSTQVFPVNLDLELVLGKMPQKVFDFKSELPLLKQLDLPTNLSVMVALSSVLRLPSVGSKRFLTNKVDRSVTGLVAQQQCVGPIHTPIADVAVTALSYYNTVGIASSIGEQPIKGLLDPAAGARMAVAEALSNLVFAPISTLQDVKCSGNWMWPAKLPGEGAALYKACISMCDVMKSLGIAVDGGKDSLSMATRLDNNTIVKSPGTLVISTYVPCVDIRQVVTPDFKTPAMKIQGTLLHIDISNGQSRLGGTALAQCFKQLGDSVSDLDSPAMLKSAFKVTQELVKENKILSGHDISDGGVITCLLEMAFAGISGFQADFSHRKSETNFIMDILFTEECGWILECFEEDVESIRQRFIKQGVQCSIIGSTGAYGIDSKIVVSFDGDLVINCSVYTLFSIWEETSFKLEEKQMNAKCAKEEFNSLKKRKGPCYKYFLPLNPIPSITLNNIKVAVLREEGTNGDREMVAALNMAGFETWDITMQDLLDENITVDMFRGIIFPGGFSYADVLGSAKGWAACLLLNKKLYDQFKSFYDRSNTFSFGVCNGCQLMALLGWINPNPSLERSENTSLHPALMLSPNKSERFESRFSTVRILNSKAIMLQGMENSILGVWTAHGEGCFTFRDEALKECLEQYDCFPIRYVDDKGDVTECYPYNPNGSPGGLAAVCSTNGRHLAMMPHPERCIQFWQWPYIPSDWKLQTDNADTTFSPWFQLFINAYNWCSTNTK